MKLFRSWILAHHPGGGLTNLGHRIPGQCDDLWVELPDVGIVLFDSLLNLQERVLDVAGTLFVREILCDVVV